MAASLARPLALDLPATVDGLRSGLAAIERHCAAADLPTSAVARTLTVFEEIFTNTMKYGYRDAVGARIRVVLAGGDPLRLVLEDAAPAFDPTAWNAKPDLTGDVADRPVGRAGIALVMGLASSVRWEALAPGNRLTLELSATAQKGEGTS
ncbi:MAG TPA: ATP-binding protein [Candidatus Sulfotelmatobacter sp.]|nr:ATP-binding protein [Candidatus Sulfotelmatobacter sp.]